MTKAKKREWLGAIWKLERFYRDVVEGEKPKQLSKCPLCIISKADDCKDCLWILYEKRDCFPRALLRNLYDIPWAKDSLKRLARWRARLEKEK